MRCWSSGSSCREGVLFPARAPTPRSHWLRVPDGDINSQALATFCACGSSFIKHSGAACWEKILKAGM